MAKPEKEKHGDSTTTDGKAPKNGTVVIGVKGVVLKHFERVVASLLASGVEPRFVKLPTPPPRRRRGCCSYTGNDATSNPSSTIASISDDDADWPFFFASLPAAARVHGTLHGQIPQRARARRKQEQLECMLQCIYALLPPSIVIAASTDPQHSTTTCMNDDKKNEKSKYSFTIVDFGGGSGHLAIPLALWLRNANARVRVIVVDLSHHSLELLHAKARACCTTTTTTTTGGDDTNRHHDDNNMHHVSTTEPPSRLRQCSVIENLYTFHGPLEEYAKLAAPPPGAATTTTTLEYRFDMGVALHLCGEATDVALSLCGSVGARSIFCPCCVGKVNGNRKNPYIWQATGGNTPTVQYPQSQTFQRLFFKNNNQHQQESEDWNALAKAADYSDTAEIRTARNATRRTAKALLETDRQYYLSETYKYDHVVLTRMNPWEATPKNDIILAWNNNETSSTSSNPSSSWPTTRTIELETDADCMADVALTMNHLFVAPTPSSTRQDHNAVEGQQPENDVIANTTAAAASVDWDWQEEVEIRKTLQEFFFDTSLHHQENHSLQVYVFPTGMGSRKRKLIHYVARQLKLAHWCEGKKESDKTVAVAWRGTRQQRDECDAAN